MPQRRVGAGAASKQPAWEGDEGRVGLEEDGLGWREAGEHGRRRWSGALRIMVGRPAGGGLEGAPLLKLSFGSQLVVWLTGCGESCGTHAGGALSFHSD